MIWRRTTNGRWGTNTMMGFSMSKVFCVHIFKCHNEPKFCNKTKMPVIPATQETGGLYLKARPCKVNRRTYLENKLENEKGCWCGEFVQHSIKCPILKKKRKKKHSAKNK
jgi:hypothetical protein